MVYAMRVLVLFAAVNALPARTSTSLLAQDAPAPVVDAAAAPAAAVAPDYGAAAAATPVDASCVSIAPGANDFWCQTTCAIPASCPVTMCKCGVTAEASPSPDAVPARSAVSLLAQDAPAPVVDAAAAVPVVAPDAAAAGAAAITPTDASCVSIAPGANDYWCQTTCFNP